MTIFSYNYEHTRKARTLGDASWNGSERKEQTARKKDNTSSYPPS